MSEEEALLAAARAGDPRAVEELLAHNAARIYRFGLRMCRNEADAQDVTQETMLAAARAFPEFRGEGNVSTWLYTIARRFCGRMRRRTSGEPERLESLHVGEVHLAGSRVAVDDDMESHRIDSWVRAALEDLDPGQKDVFILRDMEGLSAAEVARALDLSIPAVKSRLHRARASIRERLEPVLGGGARRPSCPDVVQHLSESLEGELDPGACKRLEAHVDTCSECRVRCDGLRRILGTCARADPHEALPADLESVVRARIREAVAGRA